MAEIGSKISVSEIGERSNEQAYKRQQRKNWKPLWLRVSSCDIGNKRYIFVMDKTAQNEFKMKSKFNSSTKVHLWQQGFDWDV